MENPVDKAALEELRSIMGDDFQMLIDVFLTDSVKRLDDIEAAITSQDAENLRTSAHSFKGSALNISALTLTEICKTLEHKGRDNDLAGTADLLDQVKTEFQRVKTFLEAL